MGDEVDLKFLLFMDCDEETMTKRIMARAALAGDKKR